MSVLVQATVRDKTDQTTVSAIESSMPILGENEEVPTDANATTVEDSLELATEATATAVTPDIPNATNTYYCVSILQMIQEQGNG